jgi:hypothetical protein
MFDIYVEMKSSHKFQKEAVFHTLQHILVMLDHLLCSLPESVPQVGCVALYRFVSAGGATLVVLSMEAMEICLAKC